MGYFAGLNTEGNGDEADEKVKLGTVFPQTEIGPDPRAVREFAQAAEVLGYDHILAFEQVIGPSQEHHPTLQATYWQHHLFHEPLAMFGFLAGVTHRIELATGVIVLPMRQTALVAKQAAEVDALSGGRLRLGVGVGIKPPEFEALGQEYGDRGRRCEEQVRLLKELWRQESVDFEGRWHRVTHAGINPLPVQRTIPIWFGGTSEAAMRRTARLGDGWIPHATAHRPFALIDGSGAAAIEQLRRYAFEEGRDPGAIGVEVWTNASQGTAAEWAERVRGWEAAGVTHMSLNTMDAGFTDVEEHVDALRRFKEAMW